MPNLRVALHETPVLLYTSGCPSRAELTHSNLLPAVGSGLAAPRYPRRVSLVDSLQMGPTGQITRRRIVAPQEVSAK